MITRGDTRLPERLWDKVSRSRTGCWVWGGFVDRDGYGKFWWTGQKWYAHRAFYTALVGEIPHGLVIDHQCRVRNCVNPYHLEPVTSRENTRRGDHTGCGAPRRAKTHCPQGHVYNEKNTRLYSYRNTVSRVCRACDRARK